MKHISVMMNEVLEYLDPKIGGKYIDTTCGEGGHTKEILKKIGSNGSILAIDQSEESILKAKEVLEKYKKQVVFENSNFSHIKEITEKNNFNKVDGILYDLGLASWQIDDSDLGISFSREAKLDMRLSPESQTSAREIVNKFSIKKIADILYQYGDVRGSWSVARRIELARRDKNIETTSDLKEALGTNNPKILAPIFQALRIYVNQELENLEKSLTDAVDLLKKDGYVVVISFHSGEDRIVKNIFRQFKKEKKVKVITKKPVQTTKEEIRNNSRARSAKLRAIQKI